MLKGKKVLLRPMKQEDIVRQHEFNQDPELYALDSTYPRVSPLESAQAFYESRAKFDENIAPFAIEAEGKYIGYCSLMDLKNRHGARFVAYVRLCERRYQHVGRCARNGFKRGDHSAAEPQPNDKQ